jgi:hypothetical protein
MNAVENLKQVVKSGIMILLPTPSPFLDLILHKGGQRNEKHLHHMTTLQPPDVIQRLSTHFMMGSSYSF